MTSIVSILVAIAMLFASTCAPDTYGQLTISDPVVSMTSDGQTIDLDFTGLKLEMGGGANAAGDLGVLRASVAAGVTALTATADVKDGQAAVLIDGMSTLLTSNVLSDEELAQTISMLFGKEIDPAALRGGVQMQPTVFNPADLIAKINAYFATLDCTATEPEQTSIDLFADGTSYDVTRVTFEMDAAQTQAFIQNLIKDMAMIANLAGTDALPTDALDTISGARGEYAYNAETGVMSYQIDIDETSEEGAEPDTLRISYAALMQEGAVRAEMQMSADAMNVVAKVDGTADDQAADLTMTIDMLEDGEAVMTIGATLKGTYGAGACDIAFDITASSYGSEIAKIGFTIAGEETEDSVNLNFGLTLSAADTAISANLGYAGVIAMDGDAKVCEGDLTLSVTMEGSVNGSIDGKLGMDFLTAPLEGYLVTDFGELPSVSLEEMTEEQQTELTNVASGFMGGLMAIPGVQTIMMMTSSVGGVDNAEDVEIAPEQDTENDSAN